MGTDDGTGLVSGPLFDGQSQLFSDTKEEDPYHVRKTKRSTIRRSRRQPGTQNVPPVREPGRL